MDTGTTTKACPFCAETIQAAAIVCRYCGRDLVAPAPPAVPSGPSDRAILDQEMAAYTARGWRITNQNETSFQMAQPKEWSQVGLVLFVLLPGLGACFWLPLLGVAAIGLILVLGDYLLKKERVEFVTATEIREALAKRAAATPTIVRDDLGRTICSACKSPASPDRAVCTNCGATLKVPAAIYAGLKTAPNDPPADPNA